jgi:hypothetical protein
MPTQAGRLTDAASAGPGAHVQTADGQPGKCPRASREPFALATGRYALSRWRYGSRRQLAPLCVSRPVGAAGRAVNVSPSSYGSVARSWNSRSPLAYSTKDPAACTDRLIGDRVAAADAWNVLIQSILDQAVMFISARVCQSVSLCPRTKAPASARPPG